MDHIRQDLDELMGKDRNHPLHQRLRKRDHFDDDDVCKYNLLNFCPHDLFPNTKADLGPCQKRHDDFFKEMFRNDPDKEEYQRKYEKELTDLLESMIQQVDQKIKRSLQRIETPVADHLNIPEMNALQQETAHQKIDQLEQKINFYLERAEKLGEEGQIEESEAILKEVEKLKTQKGEYEQMSDHALIPKERNMKVCEICGALQSTTDTDKRLTMHLEGKLHQGYAKIRKELATLKQKREEHRRISEKERREGGKRKSRSRSNSPRAQKQNKRQGAQPTKPEKEDEAFYFSSRKYGYGLNVPEDNHIKLTDIALNANKDVIVQLQSVETLGKEWGYYKRNIDKQRREQQNLMKDKEDPRGRRDDNYRGGEGGQRGGFRERGNFGFRGGYDNGFKRPQYPERGGDRREGGFNKDRGNDGRDQNDYRRR